MQTAPRNMNGAMHQDILEENLISSAKKVDLGRRWTFQQDNNPKQTTKLIQDFLQEEEEEKNFDTVSLSDGSSYPQGVEDSLPKGMDHH